LFLTKKIYNEYVKNTSIILKDGKNYLSSWTNTVNLSYEDIHISIQPLIFIDIDDHNKDVVGYDYLRAYCIDLALKWLLTADIINIAYDIFIKLTSYPVSAIILI
jgi:hypothetical protein